MIGTGKSSDKAAVISKANPALVPSLFIEVNNLKNYKEYLEKQCQQISPIYDIVTKTASEMKKQQTLQNPVEPTEEPRPLSPPQWQLMFSI